MISYLNKHLSKYIYLYQFQLNHAACKLIGKFLFGSRMGDKADWGDFF
jgi:hypothetical protein